MRGFFSNWLIRDDFKEEGKVPIRRERLKIENCRGDSVGYFRDSSGDGVKVAV